MENNNVGVFKFSNVICYDISVGIPYYLIIYF